MTNNQQYDIDKNSALRIMTPEEVAQFFHKSTSWVYKNWEELGGRKLGGSLVFPSKEDLYERIFGKREGVEVRLHSKRREVHKRLVRDKEKSNRGRSKKKGRNKKTEAVSGKHEDRNRYGLLDIS